MNINEFKKFKLLFNLLFIGLLILFIIGLFIESLFVLAVGSGMATIMILLMSRVNAFQIRNTDKFDSSSYIQTFYPTCLNTLYIFIGRLYKISKLLFFAIILVILYLMDTYLPEEVVLNIGYISIYIAVVIFIHEVGFTGVFRAFAATGQTTTQVIDDSNDRVIEISNNKYKRLR